MSSSLLRVVAAVIRDRDGRVLLAQRPLHKHQGGLWEFPGGKVESGESEAQALGRELSEELGLIPTVLDPLIRICHDYPDKSVELSVWQVTQWTGEHYAHAALGNTQRGREGQPVAWVGPDELLQCPFPAANQPIVSAVRMPMIWRITPALSSLAELQAWAEQRLPAALSAAADRREGWLLRLPHWSAMAYRQAADYVQQLLVSQNAQAVIALSLHGDTALLQQMPTVSHFHLRQDQVRDCLDHGVALATLKARPEQQFTAACHDAAELAMATQLGVDAAFLSPVQATPSHPGEAYLGWPAWAALVRLATLPIYALGGVTPDDAAYARTLGGQGVAGISQF